MHTRYILHQIHMQAWFKSCFEEYGNIMYKRYNSLKLCSTVLWVNLGSQKT